MLLDAIAAALCAACYGLARSSTPKKAHNRRVRAKLLVPLVLALVSACSSPTAPVEPSGTPSDAEPWTLIGEEIQ